MTDMRTGTELMMDRINLAEELVAKLKDEFFPNETYDVFEQRVATVLLRREHEMRAGRHDVEGACLLGPSGSGKTRLTKRIIANHHSLAERSGKFHHGHRIASAVLPPNGSVKETYKQILQNINGYEVSSSRTEGYIKRCLEHALREERIAALHLDEFQDLGRLKGKLSAFVTEFRLFMQNPDWPVSLIITGTLDTKQILNQVPTLVSRLEPLEFRGVNKGDKVILRDAMVRLSKVSEIGLDEDITEEKTMIHRIVQGGAGVFGSSIKLMIAAFREAFLDQEEAVPILRYPHFIRAYQAKSDADEEFNPFLVDDWRGIDARKLMSRVDQG
jgi:hypothetical protein